MPLSPPGLLAIGLLCLAPSPGLASDPKPVDPGSARRPTQKDEQVFDVLVTTDGFVPSTVTAQSGRPIRLVVTRKVERTCATEIVLKDFGVNQPLPLGQAVSISIPAMTPGNYRFSCGMGMIAGILNVR